MFYLKYYFSAEIVNTDRSIAQFNEIYKNVLLKSIYYGIIWNLNNIWFKEWT